MLPLLPLIAGQGIRLLGPQILRHLAAKEVFGLAESALASRAMPMLGQALARGENFIPGTGTLSKGTSMGTSPLELGKLLGKADIINDLAGRALVEFGPKLVGMAVPGLAPAMQAIEFAKKAADTFTTTQNSGAFLSTLSKLDLSSILRASAGSNSTLLPSLVDTISGLTQTVATHANNDRDAGAATQPAPGR